jgi:hypothetical protein
MYVLVHSTVNLHSFFHKMYEIIRFDWIECCDHKNGSQKILFRADIYCPQFVLYVGYTIWSRFRGVTVRRGMGWMIGFIDALYTPLGTTSNYSSIAISTLYNSLLHTLVSSVFNSLILAMDSLQSHCNCSTLWSLFCTVQFLPATSQLSLIAISRLPQFFAATPNSGTSQFFAATPNSGTRLGYISTCVRSLLYNLVADSQKTLLSLFVACWFTAADMCLPHSCVATSAARTHRKRRLQNLFHCCVTSQHMWGVPLLLSHSLWNISWFIMDKIKQFKTRDVRLQSCFLCDLLHATIEEAVISAWSALRNNRGSCVFCALVRAAAI